jgi:hypothetical protein
VQSNYAYLFIKCKDTTIVIEGKCKTIMLENCQNTKLVADAVVTNIEVINCKKATVQVK